MKKICVTILAMFMLSMYAFAQENTYAKQLIISNGGVYSNPDDFVTVASYNLITREYNEFDEIGTQSTQCVIVDEGFAYVAAQDSLIKYNLDTYARVAGIELTALKNLAVYQDKLVVTRQYPATDNFVYILNKSDLSEVASLSTSGEASGIKVVGDSAYVAVPGAWGTEEGKLAVIDLFNNEISKEINFGAAAKGLKDVLVKEQKIYTVNSHFSDYNNNVYSISTYDIETGDTSTTMFSGDYYGFYGYSIMTDSSILLPLSFDVASYNIYTEELEAHVTIYPSSLVYENLNQELFIAESNYVDYGKLYSFDINGQAINDTVDIGIAPEGMAIDYRELPFVSENLICWIGEGAKEAVLVVDWNDGTERESLAWGYKWDGDASASDMIVAIDEADSRISFNIEGGFLKDVVYDFEGEVHSGIYGNPDYWSTWSGANCMNWQMNMGVSEILFDGSWFGCSYGFDPEPTRPDIPVAVEVLPESVADNSLVGEEITIYPNPVVDFIKIAGVDYEFVRIYSMNGKLVSEHNQKEGDIVVKSLPQGMYLIQVVSEGGVFTKKITKQ